MTARLFNGEEVLGLLDAEGEDDGLDEIFFPGSDEELWVSEESDQENDEQRYYNIICIIV